MHILIPIESVWPRNRSFYQIMNPNFNRFSRLPLLILFIFSLLFFFSLLITHGAHSSSDGDDAKSQGEAVHAEVEEEQGPGAAERAIGVPAGLNSRWDAIKTWAELAWFRLLPSSSSKKSGGGGTSAGEAMKEAATRSFEASKETMERAATSASEVAREAAEKTKEKVKRTFSMPGEGGGEPDAEL